MSYDHLAIEACWQDKWARAKCFQTQDNDRPKYYALDMFPYPSGAGLHVGHLASYTPTDIVVRYKRAKGFNVLHPIGYDAFGLPAEQYAIQTGVHPRKTTQKAIANFRRQLKSFGYSFDWSREVSTCDPTFYKWTQFMFKKFYERGLAYQKEVLVNWCPALKTVLANEEVIEGKSERGGHPVIRKPMKQWMLKITEYADRLLEDLNKVDWPEQTKEGQRQWIGKSQGAEIFFQVEGLKESLVVYTTRPDTLFGCTFIVLAPEHPLIKKVTGKKKRLDVERYVEGVMQKSELERKAHSHKTGVFTDGYAVHPIHKTRIPIWIADYVLMDYGSGSIMAVPGHDVRDFEFATTFQLPIYRVIESKSDLPFEGEGRLINSDFLDGLKTPEAIKKIMRFLEEKGLGKKKIQYKLRDWLFSRQRYWGEPFPIVYLQDETLTTVPEEELPVKLPPVADYTPTKEGTPPLSRVAEFVDYRGGVGHGLRDTNTMPGSAASSWYFLRYLDPHNDQNFCDLDKQKYWLPVDLYVGGGEHTVGHLLYARFWQKVLFDMGLTPVDEPFQKLVHQGVVLGTDGQRMSKSRGNVINPDNVRNQYGADAARVYISFIGPFEKDKPWNVEGIEGVRRFLERVWRLCIDDQGRCLADDSSLCDSLNRLLHKTIKKVGQDIESMSFNTAVSAMMILVNELYRQESRPRKCLKILSQLLMPFAPHISEQLWSQLGGKGFVSLSSWPSYDEALVKDSTKTMAVQVNGKMRGTIDVLETTSEAQAITMAKDIPAVLKAINNQSILRIIYKPGRVLNLIIQ